MTNNPSSYIKRFVLAFILANIIFIGIFSLSFSILHNNYKKISEHNDLIQKELDELERFLESSNIDCAQNPLLRASEILDNVGKRIVILETRFGKNDARVIEQKSSYSLIELKHFELVKITEEQCSEEKIKILFFYSNIGEKEEESNRMGFILSSFKKIDSPRIMIYSFDYNLEIEEINEIKKKYDVNSAPVIIINEKDSLYLRNIDELKEYLQNNK